MSYAEFTVPARDQTKLSGKEWVPDGGIKAILCLVHGIGEHSGRYEHVATTLNQCGYTLIALDLRGHGKSEGKRGHSPDFNTLLSDIDLLLSTANKRYPNHPCFLYGHSLGGSLVLNYLIKKAPKLSGAIVTAPLLQLAFNPPVWKMKCLRFLNRINLQLSMRRGVESKHLSRTSNVVQDFDVDPLVHDQITPALTIAMLQQGEWNMQHAAEVQVPILLLHGTADTMTSVDATQRFAESAGTSCELRVWNDGFHELHNEPEKENILRCMVDWLNRYS